MLYLFLVAIQMLGGTFKELGAEQAKALIRHVDNPFAGLLVGVLATVLVQSSSVTTATIVSIAGGLAIQPGVSVGEAIQPFVPMVMGANIGTTVTNTLVSVGHVSRAAEFQRAFAGATMHDFFNLLAVVVLLPVELATGIMTRLAAAMVDLLRFDVNAEFDSPVQAAVKAGAGLVRSGVRDGLGLTGTAYALVMTLLAVLLIFVALVTITGAMKRLMAGRLERALNRALERSGVFGILIGIVVTVLVQSSSITTSLLVPMFAAGILSVGNGFPIVLGANIGTTITALLAAVASSPAGLAIALVHLWFNLIGTLLIYPLPALRRIPVRLAEGLAVLCLRSKWYVLLYVGGVFVLLPALGILLLG